MELGPGVKFTRGVQFAGIDFALFIGKDFAVIEHQNGINEITGVFK